MRFINVIGYRDVEYYDYEPYTLEETNCQISDKKDYHQFMAVSKTEDGVYKFKKFPSLKKAKKNSPSFIVKRYAAGRMWMSSDPFRPVFAFNIYNKEGKVTSAKAKKWSMHKIAYAYYDWVTTISMEITSPDGVKRTITTKQHPLLKKYTTETNNYPKNGLEEFFIYQHFLDSLKDYKDWTYYDLRVENEKLTEENNELKEKLAALEES